MGLPSLYSPLFIVNPCINLHPSTIMKLSTPFPCHSGTTPKTKPIILSHFRVFLIQRNLSFSHSPNLPCKYLNHWLRSGRFNHVPTGSPLLYTNQMIRSSITGFIV